MEKGTTIYEINSNFQLNHFYSFSTYYPKLSTGLLTSFSGTYSGFASYFSYYSSY